MQFARVRLPAADPERLSEWYASLFDAEVEPTSGETADSAPTIHLGETTLQFQAADDPQPAHLAFRLSLDAGQATDWLAERATILPVEGARSRWFEFLDATAIYFEDPAGNVLEGLCYEGDPYTQATDAPVSGVTEVGLPARETLALVEWLESAVGLSAWGSPSESFAWVGDRRGRFVVVPAGREWYPTDSDAGIVPVSVTVVAAGAHEGRHTHPKLPYEIRVVAGDATLNPDR